MAGIVRRRGISGKPASINSKIESVVGALVILILALIVYVLV
jgi:hypothetical protein